MKVRDKDGLQVLSAAVTRPCGRAGLLALFFCLLSVAHASAAETKVLKPGMLVLPFQVDHSVPADQTALGFAVQNVLENLLTLHSGLEECWMNWHLGEIFPQESDLQAWPRGAKGPPPAVAEVGMRYLLTGQVSLQQRDELRTSLELLDHDTGKKFTREIVVDLPGLIAFRREFLFLLEQAGIPAPPGQQSKMLWKEDLTFQAFVFLGQGLYEDCAAGTGQKDKPVYNPKPFQDGLKLSPDSYLLLNDLGWVLFRQEDFAAARQIFTQAIAVNPFGADALDGISGCNGKVGREAEEEGWTTKKAEVQGKDPQEAVASVWTRRGHRAFQKEDYGTAIICYEKAITLNARKARYVANLVSAYSKARRFGEGQQVLEAAQSRFSSLGEREILQIALANLHSAWAADLKERYAYEDAIQHYQAAFAIDNIYRRKNAANDLDSLGSLYHSLSQYDKALASYEQALAIRREIHDRPGEGSALHSLGFTYNSLGQYDKAIAYAEQALTIRREVKDRKGEAATLHNLAFAYVSLQQYDKAIEYSEQVLAIRRETKERVGEGAALHNLGAIYAFLDQYDKAHEYLEQALVIVQEKKDRRAEGSTLHNLAAISRFLGQYEQSIAYCEQALAIRREMKDRVGEGDTLANLMATWRDFQKPRLAVFYGKQAVNIYQEIRGNLQSLEKETQHSFLLSKEDTYRKLADVLITEGRLPEAQQVLDLLKQEEYFDFVRRDVKEADSLQGRANLTPEEAAWEKRYYEIADRVTALGVERGALLAQSARTTDEERRLATVEADLTVARQAFERFLNALSEEFGSTRQASEKVFQLRETQGLMEDLRELGTGTVALYTLVGQDKYRVILITPDAQLAREYSITAADLNRKVLAFRQVLQNLQLDPDPLAHELYEILIGPIARDLENAQAKTLMWSLDGVLRYLPMSALHDGERYLVQRYRNVVFTPASQARLKDPPTPQWKGLGLGVSQAHENFTALPAVVDELSGIIREEGARDSGGVLPGTIKLDAAFTAESMLAALRQRYPVVHIASHFQFQPGNETASFLLLGDGSHLSLSQIKTLPNVFGGVELLTLSACSTATGGGGGDGKEVEGFGVLAQRQGAKAVVATLWPVADESTKELMHQFYRLREIHAGMPKAEALRQAQLRLLEGKEQTDTSMETPRGVRLSEDERTASGQARFVPPHQAPYAHPYYWAPFILIGNWR
jgi:CHAT domain-containing protein/Tfp pilus assembly protein PilF